MPKILVVDDEAEVRNVVAAILKQAGYDVVLAEYGLNGYSKAQSEKPDLVLLDLMMPVVDGFEVLAKLKKNPATRSIPVIILTAKIDVASERECMRLGAVDYIKKPWGPRELQDRIGMALGYPYLSDPPQTRDNEPATVEEADNSEHSDVENPLVENTDLGRRGLPASRSHADADRVPSDGPGQSPELPDSEPPSGALPEYPENPALIRAQRFRLRRFSAEGYVEDGPPEKPDLSQPAVDKNPDPEGENVNQPPVEVTEDPESDDPDGQRKKFRTRQIRVRNDGIDPASLV